MKINTFKMERWQSMWEHKVDYNLSESGVSPITFDEIIEKNRLNEIKRTKLAYIQTDGTKELKNSIAKYYKNCEPENILVTNGSSEANFLLMWNLLEPGDETIFMLPNFMQIYGLMEAFKAKIKTFLLEENLNWQPNLEKLKKLVTKKTKIISITNPNNPTGSRLTKQARDLIIDLAKWADAWLLSDEVYQGAELDGEITESFWNKYPKTIITNGFSKAYGLPGIRVGWIIGPKQIIQKCWEYKDYTTITISAVSDKIATFALEKKTREKILQRTRNIINKNLAILESWINTQIELPHFIPPQAGAIAFVKYNMDINATELAQNIRKHRSVLVQPGDQLGLDKYLRFGLGEQRDDFSKALNLIQKEFFCLKTEL